MNPKEDINGKASFRPDTLVSVLLFLYFLLCVINVFQIVDSAEFIKASDPIVTTPLWAIVLFLSLGFAFSFYSLICYLKGKQHSVFSMRMSILYLLSVELCSHLFRMIDWIVAVLLMLLFIAVGAGQNIRMWLPRHKRRIALHGAIGLLLLATIVAWASCLAIGDVRHKRALIPFDDVETFPDEYTDGVVAFTPGNDWLLKDTPSSVGCFSNADGDEIAVATINGQDCSRCFFCDVVSRDCPKEMQNKGTGEVAYLDTIINDNSLFISTYRYVTDTTMYWTMATLFASEGYKCFQVKLKETGSFDNYEQLIGVMKTVRFELKKRMSPN
ncbi:MAG: hypothetical protein J6T86_00360 [Bacteroidales bacterium]|nr:hypothetical protein [Bacteroidales bacterium]